MNLSRVLARIRSEPHTMRFLVSRLLWASRLCRLFLIRRNGYDLRFYPTSVSAALWEDAQRSNFDEDVLSSILSPGDIVVDVGANVGSLALKAASLIGPTGKVYAFEANPLTCKYLKGNIRLNQMTERVHLTHCALGEGGGIVRFARSRADDMDHVIAEGGIQVPVRRLDNALDGVSRVTLLKIDVEGYEIPVLRGAARILGATDCIYVESFERQLQRYSFSTIDLKALLVASDFNVYRYTAGQWQLVQDDYLSNSCENFLAVSRRHKSKAHEFVRVKE